MRRSGEVEQHERLEHKRDDAVRTHWLERTAFLPLRRTGRSRL
jgi:hypothetical protein